MFDFYSAFTHNTKALTNPWRLLPKGYSVYNASDVSVIGNEEKDSEDATPRDEHRDRRLTDDEDHRIRRTLAGEKWPGAKGRIP